MIVYDIIKTSGGFDMATEKVSFTIDKEIMVRIKELAENEKRSTSKMVSILLDESLANRKK